MAPFEWKDGWAPDPAWTLKRRDEIPAAAGNQITI